MHIRLITPGKTNQAAWLQLITEQVQRVQRYHSFSYEELHSGKIRNLQSPEQIRQAEASLLLSQIQPAEWLVLLDDKGKQMTSEGLADFLQQQMLQSQRYLTFVIGGAFGFHESVYARANMQLSLSKMTFTHEMVRFIFLEQLYRAFTIIRNEPYHH